MSTCPYEGYPDGSFWKRAVVQVPPSSVDPMGKASFNISTETKIATAGSCFAQNIARCLKDSGFNYYVTEDCPAFIPDDLARSHGYRMFSARYGNIYTFRQLTQLILRSYGDFTPIETSWAASNYFSDPFRPSIQPTGFSSLLHLQQDRLQHFRAVRRLIETSEVFIFTLGLTEAWVDKRDGAVFPVCPGCGSGAFNEGLFEYHNFDYEETLADGQNFINLARAVNPRLKIILTVSPVPLVATASPDHVLTATTYSKSVLRAVVGKLCLVNDDIVYFPSYEIITGGFSRGHYFEDDLRTVTDQGVNHVMNSFFKAFMSVEFSTPSFEKRDSHADREGSIDRIRLICDEEVLDKSLAL